MRVAKIRVQRFLFVAVVTAAAAGPTGLSGCRGVLGPGAHYTCDPHTALSISISLSK